MRATSAAARRRQGHARIRADCAACVQVCRKAAKSGMHLGADRRAHGHASAAIGSASARRLDLLVQILDDGERIPDTQRRRRSAPARGSCAGVLADAVARTLACPAVSLIFAKRARRGAACTSQGRNDQLERFLSPMTRVSMMRWRSMAGRGARCRMTRPLSNEPSTDVRFFLTLRHPLSAGRHCP